jgi:CheY-like chemotaxis protein
MMQLGRDHSLYQYLESIETCCRRAAELIQRILSFCRKQEMNVGALDLNLLVSDFAKMLTRLIREDVSLELSLSEEVWSIEGDRSQMEQVLVNLIVNARDAMSEGGQITISTENVTISDSGIYDVDLKSVKGEYVVLTVSDQGEGIDPQTLSKIFDPFFTTKEIGKGTGLGLATVRGIISQHNGRIVVRSSPGKGATFCIYLPRGSRNAQVVQSTGLEVDQIIGGNETILLVEDDKEVLKVLSSSMTSAGYTMLTAEDGMEALEIFERDGESIDLLVTDLVMPGMGGKALARIVRKSAPYLPILFVTGHSFDIDQHELTAAPKTKLLQKPFKLNAFAHKVRSLLEDT